MKKVAIDKEGKDIIIQKELYKELSIAQEKLQAIQYELKKTKFIIR